MNVLVFSLFISWLKGLFLQKNITFALICPPIAAFPNFTLDARSNVNYNLYAYNHETLIKENYCTACRANK